MIVEDLWQDIEREAARLGVEAAALAAVIEVESAGKLHARVGDRDEPLIRFEGHWFDRRLDGPNRERARKEGLSSPRAGTVKNPVSQVQRWQMLDRAMIIDRAAALESVSWGIGQVMGGNWKMLGYASVEDLVAEARASGAGQLRLMIRYLERTGLVPALRRRDWAAVASGYNGPQYRTNAYDRKLAEAYKRLAGSGRRSAPEKGTPFAVLRQGMRGEAVADLQRKLSAAGHPVVADGVFDVRTTAAVRAFQNAHRLAVDGIVGPATGSALDGQFSNGGMLRLVGRILRWLRILVSLA